MYRIYKGDGCAAAFTEEFGLVFYKSEISLTCVLLDEDSELIAAARAYMDGRKSEYCFYAMDGSEKVLTSQRGETLAAHNEYLEMSEGGESYSFSTHSGKYTAALAEEGDQAVISFMSGDKYSVRAELVTDKYSVGFEFAGAVIKLANAFEGRFENNSGEGISMDMDGCSFD